MMLLTRMPRFMAIDLPLSSLTGTDAWCSATSCQKRLKAGDPEDPKSVSVV